jgi:hypothetical protein
MKKPLAIAMFAGMLCLRHAAAQDNVTFSAQTPSQVAAGETFDMQLSVEKPNIYGRFSLILSFPEKFIVTPMEQSIAGAQCEWDGIQALCKWDSIEDDRFDIDYRVQTPEDAQSQTIKIDIVFIYDEDGVRQREYGTLPEIKIVNTKKTTAAQSIDDSAAKTPPPDIIQMVEPQSKPMPQTPPQSADTEDSVETQPETMPQDAEYDGNIYVMRQKPYREGNKYIVRLQINKGNFDGYGCLVEWVTPRGRLNLREAKGANVEVFENESEIHFTWDNMPRRDSITLMYEVENDGDITAHGFFYYGADGAQDSVAVEERQILITKDLPVPDQMPAEISPNIIAGRPAADDSKYKDGKIRRIQNERGLWYRIQVLAWRNELTIKEVRDRLKKKHIDINDEISVDHVQDGSGFPYKYVIGHFRSFEQASQLRDYLQRTFGFDADGRPKAFLVCYYNGNRITVQAALLIQNRQR